MQLPFPHMGVPMGESAVGTQLIEFEPSLLGVVDDIWQLPSKQNRSNRRAMALECQWRARQ